MAAMVRGEGFFGLLQGRTSEGDARPVFVGVEMDEGRGGAFGVTIRISDGDLAYFLGSRVEGDLARVARNTTIVVAFHEGGLLISLGERRLKLGGAPLQFLTNSKDWIVGPLPLPRETAGSALSVYLGHGILPLIWRQTSGILARGHLALPMLGSAPAEIGAQPLAQGPALRRLKSEKRHPRPTSNVVAAATPLLPLPDPLPRQPLVIAAEEPLPVTETVVAALPSRKGRLHVPRLRIATGADGRLGVTLPDTDMRALWYGRSETVGRACRIAQIDADLVLFPGDDPAAIKAGGVVVVLKSATGGRWYGRTPRVFDGAASTFLLKRSIAKDGDGFIVESQPGRVILRGAVEVSGREPHPAALRLARARCLISEGLAMVRAARMEGTADIELVDEQGTPLLAVPRDAAAAWIRGDSHYVIAPPNPGNAN